MGNRLTILCLGICFLASIPAPCADPVFVRFNTVLGNIDVELLTNDAPNTVTNFLTYVDGGSYTNSFIHRSVPGFVFQGGGYYVQQTVQNGVTNNQITEITQNSTIVNEFKVSNTRGTIAMAKLGTGPDTATDQWFFNEVDNSANLDNQNGGFTVFGQVANAASLTVMDQIANVPVPSPAPFASPFDQIPLINYTGSLTLQNLVLVNSITRLTQTFTAWQTANTISSSGPLDTLFHDNTPNLLKYFCDIHPAVPMTATDRAALPVVGIVTVSGTKYLTLTYRQYAWKTGVTHNIQTSTDMQTWTTLTNPTITQIGTDSTTSTGDPIMQAQVPVTGSKQFIRLNVTLP